LSGQDDRALLASAAAGNEAALRHLLQRHGGRVHACALRLCQDPHTAEEITQDVFVTLLREASSFRFESALATWLYRVTLNRCHDRRRQEIRAPRTLGLPIDAARHVPAELRGDAAVEARERRCALDQALAELPPPQREVVILRFLGGLEYHEIADALQVPPGSVASRLHRALRHLGELLEQRGLNAENLL
jgi:RNA polymerase sigma-70 factor (ECF subfamily)